MKKRIVYIILSVVVCLLIGFLSGIATQSSVNDWYTTLNKPTFTPPNELFAPVWTVLYVLMGISAGIVWFTRAGASLALGREAMGMGDVTLMAMVGIWLGWQPAVLIFFLATFIGLVHGLFQLIMHRENELPFGPSLCLAAVLITLLWQPVWAWAAVLFDDVVQLGTVLGLVVLLTAVTLFLWRWMRGKMQSVV